MTGLSANLEIIALVVAAVLPLVAPLYIIQLRIMSDDEVAQNERDNLEESNDELSNSVDGLVEEIRKLRQDVNENTIRSERNMKHLHQLMVGKINDDDNNIHNPHYTPKHCPIPSSCPYHGEE